MPDPLGKKRGFCLSCLEKLVWGSPGGSGWRPAAEMPPIFSMSFSWGSRVVDLRRSASYASGSGVKASGDCTSFAFSERWAWCRAQFRVVEGTGASDLSYLCNKNGGVVWAKIKMHAEWRMP